jgi:hypothetical protein
MEMAQKQILSSGFRDKLVQTKQTLKVVSEVILGINNMRSKRVRDKTEKIQSTFPNRKDHSPTNDRRLESCKT